MNSAESTEQAVDFLHGKDDRNAGRPLRALDAGEPRQFDAENFLVEKEDGALRLVLRRRCDVAFDGEVGEKSLDVGGAQFRRMALVVKMDVTSDPVDVGLFGAQAVVFVTNAIPHSGEKARRLRHIRWHSQSRIARRKASNASFRLE